jgi:hypothetical protein
MSRDELMICIGNYLERHEFMEASNVQKQIMYSSPDRKIIPIEEIIEAMDFLVLVGLLEPVAGGKDSPCVYMRYLPPIIRKQLRKGK